MNEALINSLRCIMIHAVSELELARKWGVECNQVKNWAISLTGARYFWLFNLNTCPDQIDINVYDKASKFVNSVSRTMYQCTSIVCEEKSVNTDCGFNIIDDSAIASCDIYLQEIDDP